MCSYQISRFINIIAVIDRLNNFCEMYVCSKYLLCTYVFAFVSNFTNMIMIIVSYMCVISYVYKLFYIKCIVGIFKISVHKCWSIFESLYKPWYVENLSIYVCLSKNVN